MTYTWHLNPTIFTVYRFNNVFSTFHTPPKSAPGAPFYIGTIHENMLGLIDLNLRNIFLQSCFRVSSSRTVPLTPLEIAGTFVYRQINFVAHPFGQENLSWKFDTLLLRRWILWVFKEGSFTSQQLGLFKSGMRNHGLSRLQGPSKKPVLLLKYSKDTCEGVFGVLQEASLPEYSSLAGGSLFCNLS